MKMNFLKWMPMFIMALAALTISSCGSDDKNDNNGGNGGSGSGSGGSSSINEALLIGFWEGPVHIKGKINQNGRYVEIDTDMQPTSHDDIRADHTFTEYTFNKATGTFEESSKGTWQLDGDLLTSKHIDQKGQERSVPVKIISASGNEFVMQMRTEDMKDIPAGSELYATYRKINQ